MSSTAMSAPHPASRNDFTRRLVKICLIVFLVSLGLVVLYPLIWMALNGFKNNAAIFGNPFALPTNFALDNYVTAWNRGVKNYISSSLIDTLGSGMATVLISTWTAYGLTRSHLPGKPLFVGLVLGGLMLSPTVAVIPLVRMMQNMGLYNTHLALIILYTAFRIPFTTFLIRSYMIGLPRDLDEAARMDGASESQIFWRIILPLCKPILISCVILHVLFAWNEYLFAMIFTSSLEVQTLPVGLMSIMARNNTNYAVVFAAMTLAALPILLIFFAAQRFFIRGLTEGVGK